MGHNRTHDSDCRYSFSGVATIKTSNGKDVYDEIKQVKTVTGGNPSKANSKLTACHVELAQVEAEIEKLLDTLTGANAVLMSYANNKIEELDAKRQSLMKAIADMTAEIIFPDKLDRISGYLADWDNVDFEDRRFVIDGLIYQIKATSECVDIDWKL